MTQPETSVIIVNYNAGPLLGDVVASALSDPNVLLVLVSDNGSSDGSIAALRQRFGAEDRLRVIENGANLGFSRANNIALAQASGEWLLFLNPDCLLQPGTLGGMLAFMRDTPKAGMSGCRIDNPDGSEQASGRRSIPNLFNSFARFTRLDRLPWLKGAGAVDLGNAPLPDGPQPVEAISGAFMLVRREALDQVGPLDDGYFLHCEDLDWFMRFTLAGWLIYFVPDYAVVHHKGTCSKANPIRVEWYKHSGMLRFFRKFQFDSHPKALGWLVVMAIWARFALVAVVLWVKRLSGRDG